MEVLAVLDKSEGNMASIELKAIKKIVTSKASYYQNSDTVGKSAINEGVSVERISAEIGVPWENSFNNDLTPKSQLRRTSRRRARRI